MQRPSEQTSAEAQGPVVRRIDHVGLVVRDVEVAARYWIEQLGLVRMETTDVLDGRIRLAYLDAGDTTLQLVEPLRPGPISDYLDANGEGLHHVCFLVDDIAVALERLGEVPRAPAYRGGRGADVCFITSMPCGVLIELTQAAVSGARADDGARDGRTSTSVAFGYRTSPSA